MNTSSSQSTTTAMTSLPISNITNFICIKLEVSNFCYGLVNLKRYLSVQISLDMWMAHDHSSSKTNSVVLISSIDNFIQSSINSTLSDVLAHLLSGMLLKKFGTLCQIYFYNNLRHARSPYLRQLHNSRERHKDHITIHAVHQNYDRFTCTH